MKPIIFLVCFVAATSLLKAQTEKPTLNAAISFGRSVPAGKFADKLVDPIEQFSNHFMDDLRRLASIVA